MGYNEKTEKHGSFIINLDAKIREAFCMSMDGHTCREIAEKLNVSTMTAYNYIKKAHLKFNEESIKIMKKSAMNAMQKKLRQCESIIDNATDDKIKLHAMETYRKYIADMNKLLGLNEPEKTDITSKGEPILRLIGEEFGEL